jgi:hypothetical protein
VPPARRAAFTELVRGLPGHWISADAPQIMSYGSLPPAPWDTAVNVLALDGRPLAWTRAHGQAMSWFASP